MRRYSMAVALLVFAAQGLAVHGEGLREKLLATRDMEERGKFLAGAFSELKTVEEKKDFLGVSMGAYGPIVANEVFAPYAGQLMKDGDAGVRAAAIVALVNIRDMAHMEEIAAMADDPAAEIRAAVAYSFWLSGEKYVGRLREYLDKESSVAVKMSAFRAACLLTRTLKPGETRTGLMGAITSRLDEKEFQTEGAMGMLGQVMASDDDKAFLLKVEGFLESPDARVRAACIDAIGSMGAKSAAGPVEKFLRGEDMDLQLRALRAVNRLGDKNVVPRLVELTQSPSPSIRQEALAGLAQAGDHSTAWAVAVLLADDNAETRGKAARLIGAWQAREYFPQAQAVLYDVNARARALVALAIPDLFGKDAPGVAAKTLKDSDLSVRQYALEALVRLKAYGERKAVEEMAAREPSEGLKIDALKFVEEAVKAEKAGG